MSLIEEILADVTNEAVTTPNILRKATELGHKLGSDELQQWAESELMGYSDYASVPSYRKRSWPLEGTFQGPFGAIEEGKPIPMSGLSEDLRNLVQNLVLYQSAAALEEMAKDDQTYKRPFPYEITSEIGKTVRMSQGMLLTDTYHSVPKYVIVEALDTIKSRLQRFTLELKDNDINPDEPVQVEKQQQLVDGLVVNIIYGNNNSVAVGSQVNQQVSIVQKGDIDSLIEQLREYEVPEEDLEELRDAIKADPEATSRNLGPRVSKWLVDLTGKAASGAWNTVVKNAPGLVMEAVKQYSSGQSPVG